MVITDVERNDIEFISRTLALKPCAHIDTFTADKLGWVQQYGPGSALRSFGRGFSSFPVLSRRATLRVDFFAFSMARYSTEPFPSFCPQQPRIKVFYAPAGFSWSCSLVVFRRELDTRAKRPYMHKAAWQNWYILECCLACGRERFCFSCH